MAEESLIIDNMTSDDLDELLKRFPDIKNHITVTPAEQSATRDSEMGLLQIVIILAPPVLNFSAAILTFLAARHSYSATKEK
jgi:hypothetical protein